MKRIALAALLAAAGLVSGCMGRAGAGAARSDVARVQADVARRTGTDVPVNAAPLGACGTDPLVRGLLGPPLTEENAVRIALLNNGAVRAGYERLGVARAELVQAGLLRNPVLTATAKFFSAGPELEVGLMQSFLDLFLVPMRRTVAQADLCAEQAAVARDLVRLVYDVRRAFVTVRAAGSLVETRREGLRTASAARDLMRKLQEAGNAIDAQLTLEEAAAARAQLDLSAAEAEAAEAREPLNVLLGLQGDAIGWSVAGGLGDAPAAPDTTDVAARAQASSLDLLEERARIGSALSAAGLVRRGEGWQELDLGLVGKRESDGPWGFGPEISTALPVFDTGQARLLAANARMRQRVAHHQQLTVEVQAAARRLATRAAASRDRAEYLRTTYLPLRERLVREVLQRFNAMQIGAFEVLDARHREMDAKREHVETIRDAWLARLDLEELLAGSLNPERLEAPALPEPAEGPDASKGH